MNPHPPLTSDALRRMQELAADELLGQASVEELAELDALREQATPQQLEPISRYDNPLTDLTLRAFASGEPLPAALRARLQAQGEQMVSRSPASGSLARVPASRGRWSVALLAASIALAGGAAFMTYEWLSQRTATRSAQDLLAAKDRELQNVRLENTRVIQAAEVRLAELQSKAGQATERATSAEARLADLAQREVMLARELTETTSRLSTAELKIAKLETPIDPTALAINRTKLLEVPGTLRVAWKPFNLPDAPAEQQGVQGDVVWNDKLEQGYLRFVGLKPNDPKIEQYQIWVIDERGMEQKVSGGVFNANAAGEVIVPIDPAIDVRRVALFAVTIEEPGGTWVPSLKRRVVVAPRDS